MASSVRCPLMASALNNGFHAIPLCPLGISCRSCINPAQAKAPVLDDSNQAVRLLAEKALPKQCRSCPPEQPSATTSSTFTASAIPLSAVNLDMAPMVNAEQDKRIEQKEGQINQVEAADALAAVGYGAWNLEQQSANATRQPFSANGLPKSPSLGNERPTGTPPVDQQAHPHVCRPVEEAAQAPQPEDSLTAAWDLVAAAAMDLIGRRSWRCRWKHCSGVLSAGESPQEHIMRHVSDIVQTAQSCKMNACSGRKLMPGTEHMSLHMASLDFASGSSVRCSWEGTCTRRFTSADLYRRHIETHVVLDSTWYTCAWEGCDSHGFKSFSDLLDHALSSHMDTSNPHEDQLADTNETAPKKPPIKCLWKQCIYQFEDTGNKIENERLLHNHLLETHAQWCTELPERVLVCQWASCKKFFGDKSKFTHHLCTHSGMKSFACKEEGCDQRFTSESQRRLHVKRSHLKAFKCHICAEQGIDKYYSSQLNVREHIRVEHEKKDLVCERCSQTFKSHKTFSLHQRACVDPLYVMRGSSDNNSRAAERLKGFHPY